MSLNIKPYVLLNITKYALQVRDVYPGIVVQVEKQKTHKKLEHTHEHKSAHMYLIFWPFPSERTYSSLIPQLEAVVFEGAKVERAILKQLPLVPTNGTTFIPEPSMHNLHATMLKTSLFFSFVKRLVRYVFLVG